MPGFRGWSYDYVTLAAREWHQEWMYGSICQATGDDLIREAASYRILVTMEH